MFVKTCGILPLPKLHQKCMYVGTILNPPPLKKGRTRGGLRIDHWFTVHLWLMDGGGLSGVRGEGQWPMLYSLTQFSASLKSENILISRAYFSPTATNCSANPRWKPVETTIAVFLPLAFFGMLSRLNSFKV